MKSLNQAELDALEGMLDRFGVKNVPGAIEEVLDLFDDMQDPLTNCDEIKTPVVLLRQDDFAPDKIVIWVNPLEFVTHLRKNV